MKLRISVTPEFCGPVSVGTIELIKIIRDQCDLGLAEAKGYVDDAVLGGEIVEIPLPRDLVGSALIRSIEALDTPAAITADLVD